MHYVNVHLPKELIKEIDAFMKEHPEFGYTSRPELIKEAIREKLYELSSRVSKETPEH